MLRGTLTCMIGQACRAADSLGMASRPGLQFLFTALLCLTNSPLTGRVLRGFFRAAAANAANRQLSGEPTAAPARDYQCPRAYRSAEMIRFWCWCALMFKFDAFSPYNSYWPPTRPSPERARAREATCSSPQGACGLLHCMTAVRSALSSRAHCTVTML